MSLWWSLLWRLVAVLSVLSFVVAPLSWAILSGLDAIPQILYRPSAYWWILAATFWAVGAASPRFVCTVLWGERLSLTDPQWLTFCRGVAVTFTLLGFANIAAAQISSTANWVLFKLSAFPLLLVALAALMPFIRRARQVPNAGNA